MPSLTTFEKGTGWRYSIIVTNIADTEIPGAGTMMSASGAVVRFPHRWTSGGVTVEAHSPAGICSISQQPAASATMSTGKRRRWESN